MRTTLRKIYDFMAPYLAVVGLFLAIIFVFKLIDTIIFFSHEKVKFFLTVCPRFLYNTVVYAFLALMTLPLYALIRIFSQKTAVITLSAIFGILFLTELGMTIYTSHTGTLLYCDLIIRPVKETLFTINSTIPWWYSIPLIVCTIAIFIVLGVLCTRKRPPLWLGLTIAVIIVGAAPFIGKAPKLTFGDYRPVTLNYMTNKSWYCFLSCSDYLRYMKNAESTSEEQKEVTIDEERLRQFVAEYPEWQVPDLFYPLERKNNIPDILSPYFNLGSEKPNIVILIVESLGAEWTEDICFTPFIDSLAHHGLYWSNCLSTTNRSFGVVPAITGSVPSGMRGFQFGNMPAHNSLLSILKHNGYRTSGFYAGDWAFDCVLDYMIAQKPDYLSPFYAEYTKLNDPQLLLGAWWGYHDQMLFKRSIEHIQQEANTKPRMDLFVTLSSHDKLELKNNEIQQNYTQRAQQLIASADADIRPKWSSHTLRAASIVYADDCVRQFIHDYCALPGGKNTIFVITGDHSSGVNKENKLSTYHVPLIIWSPMLKQSQHFPALVTHNDVTPTLTALLAAKGYIAPPEYVQWVGHELDTSSVFRTNNRMLIINYSHEIIEMIYDGYLYHGATRWERENVYKIDNNIVLTRLDDRPGLKQYLANKMALYKEINKYVYHGNKLTQRPLLNFKAFFSILNYEHSTELTCRNPKHKPSEKWHQTYYIMPQHPLSTTEKLNSVRITIQAEVQVMDSLAQDQHMNLVLCCNGDNMLYPTTYKDKISKFINADKVIAGEWYPIRVSKEFIVTNADNLKAFVAINTPEYDEYWLPDCQMNIRNVVVHVEGAR